jgi:hypothetical protein
MSSRRHIAGFMASIATCGLTAFVLTASASAHTGEFAKFNYCPSTTSGVNKCIYSVTKGGKVVLGKKTVPIVNPVILQGGVGVEGGPPEYFSNFYGATNGVTLSKAAQPVPGGLSGLVNCKEISEYFERIACEGVFENGLTGVNATLELAKPASEIKISEGNLFYEEGTTLRLPVKVHLENPLLGSSCYVGSSSSPIIWNLTDGVTSPPPPNQPIKGSPGSFTPIEGGEIAEFSGTELVDNAWSAPGASGCGGFLVEYILDPIINSSVGVPSAAGKNTAVLSNSIYLATASSVNAH